MIGADARIGAGCAGVDRNRSAYRTALRTHATRRSDRLGRDRAITLSGRHEILTLACEFPERSRLTRLGRR